MGNTQFAGLRAKKGDYLVVRLGLRANPYWIARAVKCTRRGLVEFALDADAYLYGSRSHEDYREGITLMHKIGRYKDADNEVVHVFKRPAADVSFVSLRSLWAGVTGPRFKYKKDALLAFEHALEIALEEQREAKADERIRLGV